MRRRDSRTEGDIADGQRPDPVSDREHHVVLGRDLRGDLHQDGLRARVPLVLQRRDGAPVVVVANDARERTTPPHPGSLPTSKAALKED